jgi:uncharacterized protein HemY
MKRFKLPRLCHLLPQVQYKRANQVQMLARKWQQSNGDVACCFRQLGVEAPVLLMNRSLHVPQDSKPR